MAQPLTKRKKDGKRYERRPAVEAAINSVSLLTDEEFFRRLPLPLSDPEQLQTESLVHFLRDAWATKNNNRFDRMFYELVKRCRALSLKAGFSVEETDAILEEFTAFFADELCETTKYKLDFYECCFNSAFMKFRISKVSRKRKATATAEMAVGDAMTDRGMEMDGALHALFNQADRAKPPDEIIADKEREKLKVKALDAIELLPDDLKKTITLRYILDYPLHSSDSAVETVATKCGISEKQVHNRLNRAYQILKTEITEEL